MERSRYNSIIDDEADSYVHMFREGRRVGQAVTRETKALIESIVATDYDGRALIELIQNAHDALDPSTKDGCILVRLDTSRGEHGTLTVANGGTPFSEENFHAICRVALSTKEPDDGIGNKGVGFKSILQISLSPSIYSTSSRAGSAQFDGFCFRFANNDDFEIIARRVDPSDAGLASALRSNVSALKLPVLIQEVPSALRALPERGFVTAVDAELRSAAARQLTESMITELKSATAPIHLFLDRISSITIEKVATDGSVQTHTLRRDVGSIRQHGSFSSEQVSFEGGETFLLLKRTVPADVMKQAITTSRADSRIGENYERWEGDAEVAIAVRSDGTRTLGRYYTFLPMEVPSPLAAHVNGPFFGHLNRKSMEPTVPLNAALIDAICDLTVDVVANGGASGLKLAPETVVDLLSWDHGDGAARLSAAFERIGSTLAAAAIVPADSQGDAAGLDSIWIWDPPQGAVLTAAAVEGATGTPFLVLGLSNDRVAAIERLAEFCGLPIRPSNTEVADWVSAVAVQGLASQRAAGALDLKWWQTLYDELADLLPKPQGLFASSPIVLDDTGQLLSPEVEGGPLLLFHPRTSERDEAGLVLPEGLAEEVRFTHRDLDGLRGASKRQGRRWLETFVKEYSSETILEVVKRGMGGSRTEAHRRQLLSFAADVWFGAFGERPTQALRRQRLPAPTLGGWHPASLARFSDGWGNGDVADHSRCYHEFAKDAVTDIPELQGMHDALLRPPADECWTGRDSSQWFEFLEAAGVQIGLCPVSTGRVLELNGAILSGESTVMPSSSGMTSDEAAMLRRSAGTVAGPANVVRQTYTSDQPLWRLPGQERYNEFSHGLREKYAELVIRGLGNWPDATMQLVFSRYTMPTQVRWPSLVKAFLEQTQWLPQRGTQSGREVSFAVPRNGWWVRESDGPVYLAAQPRRLTRWNRGPLLGGLASVGTRFWDDASTAPDRLRELPVVAKQYSSRDREMAEIRNAYSEAWGQVVQSASCGHLEYVLITRRGELEVLSLPSDETVYVVDALGVEQARLLHQTPAPVLALRDHSLAERAHQLLAAESPISVALASEAKIDVLADGQRPQSVPAEHLVERWPWILELILMLLEARSTAFHRAGSRRISEAAEVLKSVRLADVDTIEAFIGGHPVDANAGGGLITVEQAGHPLILVASPHATARLGGSLESASKALMGLVGYPELQDALTLAVIRLARDGVMKPTREDLARALDLSEVEAVHLSVDPRIGSFLVENAEVLVAMLDPDLAVEMKRMRDSFTSIDDVVVWLADADGLPAAVDPNRIVELASRDDLPSAIQQLGIPLGQANRVLRTYGRDPLHNVEGHTRAFRAYCDRHLTDHIDSLRQGFLDDFRARRTLSGYLALCHEITSVQPSLTWLDDHWQLPETVIQDHFGRWLEDHGVRASRSEVLGPLRTVQDRNRRVIRGTMSRLPRTVRAWERKHGAATQAVIPDPGAVILRIESLGLLDFEPIDSSEIIRILAATGSWPAAMPETLSLEDLDLTNEDMENEQRREQAEDDARTRRDEIVRYGEREYSGREEDLVALIDSVMAYMPAHVLRTAPEPLQVSAAPATNSRGGSGRSVSRGKASQIKTTQIGFVGELIVAQWIEAQYGVHPKDSWRSGFRVRYLGDEGRDDLGYDFEVITATERILIEVKSTSGEESQFEMGETEVRRAQQTAPGERYVVLFLTNVLDPDRTVLRVLPNPFDHGGLVNYTLLGQKVRLSFIAGEA